MLSYYWTVPLNITKLQFVCSIIYPKMDCVQSPVCLSVLQPGVPLLVCLLDQGTFHSVCFRKSLAHCWFWRKKEGNWSKLEKGHLVRDSVADPVVESFALTMTSLFWLRVQICVVTERQYATKRGSENDKRYSDTRKKCLHFMVWIKQISRGYCRYIGEFSARH